MCIDRIGEEKAASYEGEIAGFKKLLGGQRTYFDNHNCEHIRIQTHRH